MVLWWQMITMGNISDDNIAHILASFRFSYDPDGIEQYAVVQNSIREHLVLCSNETDDFLRGTLAPQGIVVNKHQVLGTLGIL